MQKSPCQRQVQNMTKPVYFLKVFYLNDPNHDIRVPFEFRQPWAMICFVWLFSKSMATTIIDSEIVTPHAILLFLNISTRAIDGL
jgi:hypothetical protein